MTLLNGWARRGLTDEQIAHNCGVSVATLYNWKSKHLEILEALKKGKEIIDLEVENALLKRALGYEYTEQSIELDAGKKKVKQTVKHVPPDVGAGAFWLKNRRPDLWRDKQPDNQPEMSGTDPLTEAIYEAVKHEKDVR